MKATAIDHDRLHGNHLAFFATHRGEVVRNRCCLAVKSERPEYQCAMLRAGCNVEHAKDESATIHVLPSALDQIPALEQLGYNHASGFSYMAFGADTSSWTVPSNVHVKKAATPADIEDFSRIQGLAFAGEEHFAEWHPFLHKWNSRNADKPEHRFYVGYVDGDAVGTCLALMHDRIVGLYAVGTLVNHRKKGIATVLMKQAVDDALADGCEIVTLQVVTDSYAESFYKKLGFNTEFQVRIFKRG
ncbi:MAG TPA: GNAT family N-acetyltransferase [Candidatus Obscuribacterales bacterium]